MLLLSSLFVTETEDEGGGEDEDEEAACTTLNFVGAMVDGVRFLLPPPNTERQIGS